MTGVPHVEKCSERRVFGEGRHARTWVCRVSPAPHEGVPHDFGIDAEVYGRNLDTQQPEWLAAKLRDVTARNTHLQAAVDEQRAISAQLAELTVSHKPISYRAGEWVRRNMPAVATRLDALGRRWHDHVAPR